MSEQAICEICGEPMPPGEEMFKFHGYSGPCPKPPLPHLTPLTKDDVGKFNWGDYEKIGTTRISDQILPAQTRVMTSEGLYICEEPSRLAIDANGNVYPIAESVFEKSYRPPVG